MKAGFTGSRRSVLSSSQKLLLVEILRTGGVTEFHHGDCVGADAEAHALVRKLFPDVAIVLHPPLDGKHRARCAGDASRKPMDYMDRNRALVDECDILIALPADNDNPRSGTLATIHYAESKRKRVIRLS